MKRILPLLVLLFMACSSNKDDKSKTSSIADNRPNIIFVMVDDQGYGDVGAFYQKERAKEGLPYQITPNLNQMAEEGAMFTQHYSSSPVCAPSRASLLTGVHQGHANVRDNQFDKALEENYSMAATLKALGYKTAAIGKWGLQGDDMWAEGGSQWPAKPTNRGFDYFFGYMRHSDGHEHYPKEGIYRGQKEVWMNDEMITDKLDKSYTTDLWTAAAKKWIVDRQKENQGQPFFMYLAYDTPHAVLELPTQAYPEGEGLEGGVQWVGEEGRFINTASGEVDSYVYPEYASATYDHDENPETEEVEWPETYKRYATANRRIDDAMGDLLQLLKDLEIDSNTLVVYTSDNGVSAETYLGDWQVEEERNLPTFFRSYGPFDGIKRDTWEGGLRMPTIAWWPGTITEGSVIDQPSAHYDWPATFVEMAGAQAPARMDGVSLLPTLTGEGNQETGIFYTEYFVNGKTPNYKDFVPNRRGAVRKHMQNIRLGDYVGVRYSVESAEDDFELYNVVEDPQQITDLANSDNKITIDRKDFFGKPEKQEIRLKDLAQEMKAKVLQMRMPAQDIERPYDNALIPSLTLDAEQGLDWHFYKGEFSWIPTVFGLKSTQSGTVTDFEEVTEKLDGEEAGLLFLTGYLNVPEEGSYTLYLKSNQPALMRIHAIRVLDADYQFEKEKEFKATLNLQKGWHPFRLYFNKSGEKQVDFTLKWDTPTDSKKTINSNNFYKKTKK